jgi:hypothetical protein
MFFGRNYVKHIETLCGQNAAFRNVTASGALSYHEGLKGKFIVHCTCLSRVYLISSGFPIPYIV